MNRVAHFEIHAKNMDKMQKFYQDVFGWKIKDMGPKMGNYRMVTTGKDKPGEKWPGINGGLNPRQGALPKKGQPVNAFVCTVGVEDIDKMLKKITASGGSVAVKKMEIPGDIGTLAYCKDPEGNLFGLLQPVKT
jgi:predicted enzyme related to lactoylglutathione lyase